MATGLHLCPLLGLHQSALDSAVKNDEALDSAVVSRPKQAKKKYAVGELKSLQNNKL